MAQNIYDNRFSQAVGLLGQSANPQFADPNQNKNNLGLPTMPKPVVDTTAATTAAASVAQPSKVATVSGGAQVAPTPAVAPTITTGTKPLVTPTTTTVPPLPDITPVPAGEVPLQRVSDTPIVQGEKKPIGDGHSYVDQDVVGSMDPTKPPPPPPNTYNPYGDGNQIPKFDPYTGEPIPESARIRGRYTQGGYEPIADDKEWKGAGYSGTDPRQAENAPPPLADQARSLLEGASAEGGKAGQASDAVMAQAGGGQAFSPGGAEGGKGGGETPASTTAADSTKGTRQQDGLGGEDDTNLNPTGNTTGNENTTTTTTTTTPATGDEEADSVPATTAKDDEWKDPGATDFSYDDTGSYNESTGFNEPFTPEFEQRKTPGYHKPEAQKRIDAYTAPKREAWVAAGGRPEDFQVFDPVEGSFDKYPRGPERLAARRAARAVL